MIRDHVLSWYIEIGQEYQDFESYVQAVRRLPDENQEAALALWNSSGFARNAILVALHNIERGREILREQRRAWLSQKHDN